MIAALGVLDPDIDGDPREERPLLVRDVELESIVAGLELPIRVFPHRAEEVLEITTFDTLVARGLAPLAKVLTWLKPHWDAFDRLLLIKGRSWTDERADARHLGLLGGRELRKAASYQTPGNDAESVILSISPGSDTD